LTDSSTGEEEYNVYVMWECNQTGIW